MNLPPPFSQPRLTYFINDAVSSIHDFEASTFAIPWRLDPPEGDTVGSRPLRLRPTDAERQHGTGGAAALFVQALPRRSGRREQVLLLAIRQRFEQKAVAMTGVVPTEALPTEAVPTGAVPT